MSDSELDQHVSELVSRLERRYRSEGVDLDRRARTLAKRFDLPRPASITWAEQRDRWGSCTPATKSIRISTRLAAYPPWVLDYVVVHELAHLVIAGHDARFHALVDRYPLAERARGFLMAVSFGDAGAPEIDTPETDARPPDATIDTDSTIDPEPLLGDGPPDNGPLTLF